MRATVGDRVIVEGTHPGVPRRDGEVIALHRADGEPPWEVRWSDTGHPTLFFPGPDTHLQHFGSEDRSPRAGRPAGPRHTTSTPGQNERSDPGRLTTGDRTKPGSPGDLARRIALRREQLGLTREETAIRAGMAPPTLEYLETWPVDVERGALARLAAVLDTSVTQLLGADSGLPPGRTSAAAHPVLEALARSECWERLSTDGVGRIALNTAAGPLVLPVNYWVLDGTLIFRTASDGPLAAAVGQRVALEVDRIDDLLHTGWSVLATGTGTRIDDRPALAHLEQQDKPSPWAGGRRDLWIRIKPTDISGRTIRTTDAPPR